MYKILIRPLEENDSEISWKWRNDEEVWKHTGSRPNILVTQEIEREWINNVLNQKNSRRFAITVDDKYVGNIQLTNITSENAEYHIFIGDKDFWGKGIGFSATQQIIRFAKNVLNLSQLYLFVKKENDNAFKLYQRCGFVQVSEEIKMIIDLNCMKQPMVSVFCMVYNHEKYIAECLEGILMQKCNFNFEIVVGEDSSTDKSREILLEYQNRYPGNFKLLLHETNIGAARNQMEVLKNCNGKYIAMCEGDDYWIDPLKLQKQVDFLEKNNDFSICFTDYVVYNESNIEYSYPNLIQRFKNKMVFTNRNIILNNIIPTATAMFRVEKEVFSKLDLNLYPGDWFLHILNGEYGKIKFLPFESAVYRKHDGGVCSATSPLINNQKYLKSIKIFRKVYSNNYKVQFLFNIVVIKTRLQNIKFKLFGE